MSGRQLHYATQRISPNGGMHDAELKPHDPDHVAKGKLTNPFRTNPFRMNESIPNGRMLP
jgi:hypothetical protein